MTLVRLTDVNVRIPIYDSHALRLIRLPAFGRAKVGTQAISHSGAVLIIHALNSLNLELHEGDRVCLIGHNGAGKTTLLRVLAGIYPASTGKVEVVGKVFALLGNSMMMNPDATGYETIRLVGNPSITGRRRMQSSSRHRGVHRTRRVPSADRVYSAGMQTRRSPWRRSDTDILLVDEGIGAGDAQFQHKAQARVQQFISRAKIIVLASHSIELCRAMCTKALILNKGTQVFFGDIEEGLDRYAQLRNGPA
jgi:ABC-2 type transport system ATP-binding protein/lipopolysaccharide transport system ATP-binding protein